MEQNSTGKPKDLKATRVTLYNIPENQQGWRGIGLPGSHKRKCYTVLHNDKVLVTALLTLPGETSVRHAHESGELSFNFMDRMNPSVTWHPPGEFHGGAQISKPGPTRQMSGKEEMEDIVAETLSGTPEVKMLLAKLNRLESQFNELQQWTQDQLKPKPAPRLLMDIIFPPFKTIIDDPEFPPIRTVTGQWFD